MIRRCVDAVLGLGSLPIESTGPETPNGDLDPHCQPPHPGYVRYRTNYLATNYLATPASAPCRQQLTGVPLITHVLDDPP